MFIKCRVPFKYWILKEAKNALTTMFLWLTFQITYCIRIDLYTRTVFPV